MKELFMNPCFILLCLSLDGLYFVITGIQYWITDYLINRIKQPESTVFLTFGIISITAPIFGVIAGGNLTTYLGGYLTKKSLYLSCISAFLCLLCSAPIPFIYNFYGVICLLWLLLFFGGSILPCLTGIMLNTVDQNQKTIANSIANLSYNLLGYLPAPFLYGVILDSGKGQNFLPAMSVLMFWPFISVLTLYISAIILLR